jgi:ABC-2 type transport system ATP-binding protein
MPTSIVVEGLRKSFGDREVVSGIGFEVVAGECFGFLGHNGAGKTVSMEILEGYLSRDAGHVSVLGEDPAHPSRQWRERIGVVLQEMELLPTLTVAETISMFADLYADPRSVPEVMDLVGMTRMGSARVAGLSGGERRRVDVAVGLVGNPELLFLDEPTTGFDPASRREAWRMIEDLRELGVTIVLTTHYMDEAEALADRLLILKQGHVVATGTYDELVRAHGQGTTISFRLPPGLHLGSVRAATGSDYTIDGGRAVLLTPDPQPELYRLTTWAEEATVDLAEIEVTRASLEDVFLSVGAQVDTQPDTDEGTRR